MASKTRLDTGKSPDSAFTEFKDYELQATMRDFLEEEEKDKSSIWNLATIAGIAMFFVSMLYILQLIGLISPFDGLMNVLPVIGTILIVFIGFGFWVGDRKRVKRILKKQRKQRKEYFDSEFGTASSDTDDDFTFKNDLFNKSSSGKTTNPFSTETFDNYALGQSKKLYKSRTDKKCCGVCGGLGKYFGISSNIIRFLFIVTFLAGAGAPILIYIALAIALDKEPPELMDDFNYQV